MKEKDNRDYDEYEGPAVGIALGVILMIVAAVVIIFAVLSLSGCSPKTVYVPVENVRTEYRDRDVQKLSADTVNNTRVVFIKGDTVLDIRQKEHLQRIEIHDTCYFERTDTIREPYPVERELSRWEQAKMDFGGAALALCAIVIVGAVVWLARRFI